MGYIWNLERAVRRRAGNRGFQIIGVRGREEHRRRALGIGPYMLIDTERMHLFAATLEEIDAFLADKPEVVTSLHDNEGKRLLAMVMEQRRQVKV
jgi:hypothetical protein